MSRPRKKPIIEDVPDEKETPLQEAPVVEDNRKIIRVYTNARDPLHHPFQNRWIPSDVDGVEVIEDSWLRCQIDAGLIKEL